MQQVVDLGTKCKDKVTGFIGIATAKLTYLAGSTSFYLEGLVKGEGELKDGAWFREGRLSLADEATDNAQA